MSSTEPPTSAWPTPLVIPPTSGIHTKTFILLHGRGSTAETFAQPLLEYPISSLPKSQSKPQSFHSHFPQTKFIFPTARLLRARCYNRALTHQWFDTSALENHPPTHNPHIQVAGLRESVKYIHELIREAAKEVGEKNVFLLGLSQGSAAICTSVLLWEGEALGGVLGMCGWLPFVDQMGEASAPMDTDDEDLFDRDAGDEEEESSFEKAVQFLREELDLPLQTEGTRRAMGGNSTPFFLVSGESDPKVPPLHSRKAASLLRKLDIPADSRVYDVGHWYNEEMLRDMIEFIQNVSKN